MRRTRSSGGAELVEFAIVAVLFVVFLLGVIDWGMTMFIEHTVSLRTGEAARYTAVRGSPATAGADLIKLQNIILYGDPDCSGCSSPFMGLSAGDINVQEYVIQDNGVGTGAVESNRHLSVTVNNLVIRQFTPFFGRTINSRPIVAVHVIEPNF